MSIVVHSMLFQSASAETIVLTSPSTFTSPVYHSDVMIKVSGYLDYNSSFTTPFASVVIRHFDQHGFVDDEHSAVVSWGLTYATFESSVATTWERPNLDGADKFTKVTNKVTATVKDDLGRETLNDACPILVIE